jgi:hypothetical protein
MKKPGRKEGESNARRWQQEKILPGTILGEGQPGSPGDKEPGILASRTKISPV